MNELPIEKYEEAEVREKEARERLAQIIEKQDKAAKAAEQFTKAAAAARADAESTMQNYLVGKVGEEELAAARKRAEVAESQRLEAEMLVKAIGDATTLQRQAVEDSARAREHARKVFWHAALELERRSFIVVAGESIRRVHALALLLASPGTAYTVTPRAVVDNILGDFIVNGSAMEATLAAMSAEFGVPIR